VLPSPRSLPTSTIAPSSSSSATSPKSVYAEDPPEQHVTWQKRTNDTCRRTRARAEMPHRIADGISGFPLVRPAIQKLIAPRSQSGQIASGEDTEEIFGILDQSTLKQAIGLPENLLGQAPVQGRGTRSFPPASRSPPNSRKQRNPQYNAAPHPADGGRHGCVQRCVRARLWLPALAPHPGSCSFASHRRGQDLGRAPHRSWRAVASCEHG